jgi:RimJ/RimL family protein N-acetyltransferase
MGVARPPRELAIAGLHLAPVWEADEAEYTDVQVASHDHLARFEGWAQRLPSLAATRAWFDLCRQGWETGERFVYAGRDDAGELVGSAGLHLLPEDHSVYTIGYWTVLAACNRGHATAGAAGLTWAAFGLPGVSRVEVHCDAANAVSARIPRHLGFELTGTRSRPLTAPAQLGRDLVFACTREAYPRTYAHRYWVEHHRPG